MPRISVITGYYNRKYVLHRTIDSIIGQQHADFELIVFDDASIDGTAAELRSIAGDQKDPRLKLRLHDTNIGFTQGMINAIDDSDSEYIAVQGSGDISLPGRLAKQAALLDQRQDVGVVGCWYNNVSEETGVRRSRTPVADDVNFEALRRNNIFSHGEVMFRRSAYNRVGGYRAAFRYCQDYDLWLRMIRVCRFASVREHLYDRYVRFDGVSYNPDSFALQARYSILCQRFATLPDPEQKEELTRLADEGPLPLINQCENKLQMRFLKASLRAIIWGRSDQGKAIARSNICSLPMRLFVETAASVLGSPFGRPALIILRRILGVS